MYYSNGDIYEGQWHNDKPEGEGMLRLSECPAPSQRPAGHAHSATPSRHSSPGPCKAGALATPIGPRPRIALLGWGVKVNDRRQDLVPALGEFIL